VKQVTASMEQSSWESDSSSASQEKRILWNTKVHCRIHKNPPLVPIVSQMNPIHTFQAYFCKFYFNITLPFTPRFFELSIPVRLFDSD
jgi:hypothetical protein